MTPSATFDGETPMFKSLLFVTAVVGATACGSRAQPAPSALQARYQVPAAPGSGAAVTNFLAHARRIQTAGYGRFTIGEMFVVVPLSPSGRNTLNAAYPNGVAVTCRGALCQLTATGAEAAAQITGQIGDLTNPDLEFSRSFSARFVLRGSNAVEVCGITGVDVRKQFVTREVQGMYVSVVQGAAAVTVNMAGSTDFTCG